MAAIFFRMINVDFSENSTYLTVTDSENGYFLSCKQSGLTGSFKKWL